MSKKIIAISGSPGTGKSTLAQFLAKKLGFSRLDLHLHYKEISTNYNQSKKCYEIDAKKFEKLVKKEFKKSETGLVVDSHISHLLSKKMVNLGVILICSNLKILQKRLQDKKYSRQKVRENLDAEIFQVCLMEAQEKGHKIIIFDTGKRNNKESLLKKIKSLL